MNDVFLIKESAYLSISNWERKYPSLVAGFTTKTNNYKLYHEKQKKSIKEREELGNKLGFPLTHWISGKQTHGTNIQVVTYSDQGRGAHSLKTAFPKTDGLITEEKNILLTAYFADCVPLYFYNPDKSIIGVAHAGWKGTIKKIAQQMVLKLISLGASVQTIFVTIGPAISLKNYEVGEDIITQIDEKLREKVVRKGKENHYYLDLKELNRQILLQSGILRHNIDITNHCTYTDKHLFYSHRREQVKAGRMLAFIGQT